MKTIAYFKSPFKEKFFTPRQAPLCPEVQGEIQFCPPYSDSAYFRDLELSSHLWILSLFHQNQSIDRARVKIPREPFTELSVFATRSPHRPNSVGLTLAKILEIKETGIRVGGVDLVDQTPIIDLKPYIPGYDSPSDSWSNLPLPGPNQKVEFSPEALEKLQNLAEPLRSELKTTLEQSLRLDPRPRVYHKIEKEYGALVLGFNVKFNFVDTEKGFLIKDLVKEEKHSAGGLKNHSLPVTNPKEVK